MERFKSNGGEFRAEPSMTEEQRNRCGEREIEETWRIALAPGGNRELERWKLESLLVVYYSFDTVRVAL